MSRQIKFKPNTLIKECPVCRNNTSFTIHSSQVGEDMCEIWAVCKCGYDPTAENTLNRMEDVWGGTSDDNCKDAISFCWNDLIQN